MANQYINLVKSLHQFAAESQLLGGPEVLASVTEHLNRLFEMCRNDDPTDPFWSFAMPLKEGDGYGHVILACTLLEGHLESVEEGTKQANCWHVTKDSELKGHYTGEIIVDPGCTFRVFGAVNGNVTLFGDAALVCMGAVNGDVTGDEASTIESYGALNGSITYRKPAPAEAKEDSGGAQ